MMRAVAYLGFNASIIESYNRYTNKYMLYTASSPAALLKTALTSFSKAVFESCE